MTLQMFDVEIDDAQLEDFAPAVCETDALIEIVESDVVEVFAPDEDATADVVAPLRNFWDCPPLALAGIICAMISFAGVVLFYGLVATLMLWSTGLL